MKSKKNGKKKSKKNSKSDEATGQEPIVPITRSLQTGKDPAKPEVKEVPKEANKEGLTKEEFKDQQKDIEKTDDGPKTLMKDLKDQVKSENKENKFEIDKLVDKTTKDKEVIKESEEPPQPPRPPKPPKSRLKDILDFIIKLDGDNPIIDEFKYDQDNSYTVGRTRDVSLGTTAGEQQALSHFIASSLRPDLTKSALSNEVATSGDKEKDPLHLFRAPQNVEDLLEHIELVELKLGQIKKFVASMDDASKKKADKKKSGKSAKKKKKK